MRARLSAPPVAADAARVSAWWFGIQAVWSALLGVFLQSRIAAFAGADALRAYGLVAAGGACVAAVVQIVAGAWSDRRVAAGGHRRAFYLAGAVIAIGALAWFFGARSLGELVAAFGLVQVGMNVAGGPYQAAIPDAFPAVRAGRASGWMGAASFAGSVTGLVVAATLSGPLAGAVLIACLAGSAGITLAHLRRLPAGGARAVPFAFTRDIVALLGSRGAINVGFYTLFGFLFFFVRESLGIADARTTTGLLFIGFTLAGAGGAALGGRAADRADRRAVVTAAAAVMAVAVVAFALAPTVVVAAMAAVAAGAGWGAFFSADWAIAYALLPRGAMAAALGVWNLATVIPQILAPAATAPLVAALDAQHPGAGPRAALALVALEFVAGAALIWCIPAERIDARQVDRSGAR